MERCELEITKMSGIPLRVSRAGKVIAFDDHGICQEFDVAIVKYNYNTATTNFFHNWEENLPPSLAYKIMINREGPLSEGLGQLVKELVPGKTTLSEFSESINQMVNEVLRKKKNNEKEWLARGAYSSDSTLEDFILKTKVEFRREPENKNRNTFDFVEIEVSIPSWSAQQCSQFISMHKNEFLKKCIEKLEENKKYQEFGVPTSFLKVSNLVLRQKIGLVNVLFEFKNKIKHVIN